MLTWALTPPTARKRWGWGLGLGSLASKPVLFTGNKLNGPMSVRRGAACQVSRGQRNEKPHLKKLLRREQISAAGGILYRGTPTEGGRGQPHLWMSRPHRMEEDSERGVRSSTLTIKIRRRLKTSLLKSTR